MQLLITSTLSIALSSIAFIYSQQNVRIVKMNSFWDQLVWTYRATRAKHPLPQIMADWDIPDEQLAHEEVIRAHWKFLGPFFASHGYTLYEKVPRSDSLAPARSPLPANDTTYPYSRRYFTDEEVPQLNNTSPRVWGARDELGRDVVIKVVSEVTRPSEELKILKRLNEKELRSEPHNHTIYSIDYLTFDNFVFVVMPRWDCAVWPHFATVSELMEFAKAMLEALGFLHSHRIVHHDSLAQNIGMNAVFADIHTRPGLRDPDKVRYALYDFGYSVLYPADTDLDDARTTRFLLFPRGMTPPKGPYNPFKADVAKMGATLQTRVRHIENKIPDLGPFFDRMLHGDEETRFSAQEALTTFLTIYDRLTEAQLKEEVATHMWKIGGIVTKKRVF